MPSRLSLLATVLFSGVLLRGQSCKSLPSTLLQTISEAVSTRFQLAPDLTIEDQGTVNDSCYRRLMVRSQEPKRAFALYVSPDQRFVTPDLIDLTLSNNAEAQRERNEVSKLLEQGRSPSNGPDKAEVTVVEFSDFQCPYCKRLAYYISRARQEGFTFRLIFKHAPLPQHSWAKRAALMASCVADQQNGGFWLMHDFLFSSQESLTQSTLDERIDAFVAGQSGAQGAIDSVALRTCVKEGKARQLEMDGLLAQRFHVIQTPTVFINGVRRVGFSSFEEFTAALKGAQAVPYGITASALAGK